MNFNSLNTQPKLLISDALKGVLSEDELSQIDDMFITVALICSSADFTLAGNLMGIEFGENPKIDIKVPLKNAFNFIGTLQNNKNVISSIVMMLAEDTIKIVGPFNIVNTKIVEIDSSNKLCILAIDLIKNIT